MERALARLADEGAVLAREREGAGFGVFPRGDRRRRPTARLSAAEVRALESEGVLSAAGADAFVLSQAGRARMRREAAPDAEQFLAQHAPIIDRAIMDGAGEKTVRGFDSASALRRLAALRDARGGAWLNARELAAANALHADWARAQAGLVRGSDWRAPPKGASARGGAGHDAAMAARCDSKRAFEDKLAKLAAPLRRAVERVVLYEDGIEALERGEGWPARSGKLALKLGLAQLAMH